MSLFKTLPATLILASSIASAQPTAIADAQMWYEVNNIMLCDVSLSDEAHITQVIKYTQNFEESIVNLLKFANDMKTIRKMENGDDKL